MNNLFPVQERRQEEEMAKTRDILQRHKFEIEDSKHALENGITVER